MCHSRPAHLSLQNQNPFLFKTAVGSFQVSLPASRRCYKWHLCSDGSCSHRNLRVSEPLSEYLTPLNFCDAYSKPVLLIILKMQNPTVFKMDRICDHGHLIQITTKLNCRKCEHTNAALTMTICTHSKMKRSRWHEERENSTWCVPLL